MTARALPPVRGEAERRRQLGQMKRRATGLLLGMAAAFVAVTLLGHGRGWSGYLQAALEASLVGGLADWFAVTALFRHPLGIPIPHTAVIPQRKDQFGRSLGEFVQENFLSPDTLAERIRSGQVAARVADWLADRRNAEAVAGGVGDLLAGVLSTISDDELDRLLATELRRVLDAVPIAPLAGRTLELAVAHGVHRDLFDRSISGLAHLLGTNREAIQARFRHEAPWWLPNMVDDRIFDRLFDGVLDLLEQVRTHPDHEIRVRFDEWAKSSADRWQQSPEVQAQIEEHKRQLLDRAGLAEGRWLPWADGQAALRSQVADPGSAMRRRLADAVVTVGERVRSDPTLLARIDQTLESAAASMAEHLHADIAGLVTGTIDRWNGQETAGKLELLLGRDLQFIRINGTVVGGIAGLAIHAVAKVLA